MDGTWLEPEPAGDLSGTGGARWVAWAERAVGGDLDRLAELLERRGMDVDRAQAALGAVRIRRGVALPPWVAALAALLRSAEANPAPHDLALARSITAGGALPVADGQSIPVREGFAERALAAFLPWARERLRAHGQTSDGLEDGIAAGLLRQVLFFSLPSLRGHDDAFPPDEAPLDGWAAVLNRSPALARVLGVLASSWADSAGELLERFGTDAQELRALLGDVSSMAAPIPVSAESGAGDRHSGGRCVTEIELEGGERLYYKPKDPRLGDAFRALVNRLDLGLALPARLSRTGYAFEVAICERKPSSPAAWRRLARELGMWVRLFSVLGGSDLLKVNVLIAGDQLVPVDTETIVPFLFVHADELPWQPAGARLGLITAPLLTRAEMRVEDFGLLADGSNAPILEHVDALVEGFAVMHRRLVERRAELLCVLEGWEALPARAILRNTWVYMRLLLDSLTPQALADGVERDLVLERLWRAHARFGLAEPLVEAEVAALRDLDIPLFHFSVGGRDLIVPGGRVAPAVLHEPSLAGVRERLSGLTLDPEAADLDGLRTLAFCAAPGHRADGDAADRRRRAAARLTTVNWAGEAGRVGRELLGFLRRGGPGGDRLRAGLAYVPHNVAFGLPALRTPDVLSGDAGIAIELAALVRSATKTELGGASDSLGSELAAEAELLVAQVREQSRHVFDDVERWLDSGKDPPLCGPYWGLPAWLYCLCAIPGDIPGAMQPRERREATELLEVLDPGRAWPEGRLVPAAGLLLAAEMLAESRGRTEAPIDASFDAVRERLCAYLVEHWHGSWHGASVDPVLAGTVPSPRGSAALALWRHSRNTGSELPEVVTTWQEEGRFERDGDRLVLLAMGGAPCLPPAPDASLGLLSALESAIVAYRVSGEPEAEQRAAAFGEQLLARRERFGRWFPESHAADRFRLSALWGLAAVAHAFSCLASPGTAWSLRLLELPPALVDRK
jgi:hypothetical protein